MVIIAFILYSYSRYLQALARIELAHLYQVASVIIQVQTFVLAMHLTGAIVRLV
jgi:hypothetical protein